MKDLESRTIFAGPSLGLSILCAIPLVALKLFGIVETSWLWVTCPIWLGWVICFLVWIWFSSLTIVCKCIKPVCVPVFVPSSEVENDGKEKGKENKEDGM